MIYRWENERAGGMSFGIGEARLIDQVCLQMGSATAAIQSTWPSITAVSARVRGRVSRNERVARYHFYVQVTHGADVG